MDNRILIFNPLKNTQDVDTAETIPVSNPVLRERRFQAQPVPSI